MKELVHIYLKKYLQKTLYFVRCNLIGPTKMCSINICQTNFTFWCNAISTPNTVLNTLEWIYKKGLFILRKLNKLSITYYNTIFVSPSRELDVGHSPIIVIGRNHVHFVPLPVFDKGCQNTCLVGV